MLVSLCPLPSFHHVRGTWQTHRRAASIFTWMVCWSQRKAGQGEAVDPTSLRHLLMFKLWLFQIPQPAFSFFPLWSAFLAFWELWRACFNLEFQTDRCSDFWHVDSNLARQRLRDLEIEKLQGLRNDARHQWAELVLQHVFSATTLQFCTCLWKPCLHSVWPCLQHDMISNFRVLCLRICLVCANRLIQ